MKKRLLSILISVVMLISCVGYMAFAEETAQDTILRLGLFSDTHNNEDGITNVLNNIYTLTNNDVDGVIMTGDIIYMNQGETPSADHYARLLANEKVQALKSAGNLVYAMGNHEFPLNETDTEEVTASKAVFEEQMGFSTERDLVLGGYHFITASAKDYTGEMSQEGEAYLREKIEAALDDGTNKPVFVALHHPVYDTFYGTDVKEYSDEFMEYIKAQPRLIVLSGHLHYPSSDPKTIYQEENGATFVQTSHVAGGNNVEDPYATQKSDAKVSQAMIVEIDQTTNVVKFKRFNVTNATPEFLAEDWVLDIPAMADGEESAYKYTEARAEKSVAPKFGQGNLVVIKGVTDSTIEIDFSAASKGAEGEDNLVEYYEIKVEDTDSARVVKKEIIISDYFKETQKTSFSHTITGLNADTDYRVSVCAVTPWFVKSNAIYGNAKTTGGTKYETVITKTHKEISEDKSDYRENGTVGLSLTSAGYAVWEVTPEKDGLYELIFNYGVGGDEGTTTSNVTAMVDGDAVGTYQKASVGNWTNTSETVFATVALKAGTTYEIKFKNSGVVAYLKSMTLGYTGSIIDGYEGYTISKTHKEIVVEETSTSPGTNGLSLTSTGYAVWSITPECNGVYELVFNYGVGGDSGTTNSKVTALVDGETVGTYSKTSVGSWTTTSDSSFGQVVLEAGKTYKIMFKNSGATAYLKNIKLTWVGEVSDTHEGYTISKKHKEIDTGKSNYMTNNMGTNGLSLTTGNYAVWSITPEYDGMYEIKFNYGVNGESGTTNSLVTAKVNNKTVGTYAKTSVGNWTNTSETSFGTVALFAGETYEIKFDNTTSGVYAYLKSITVSWVSKVDMANANLESRFYYTATKDENGKYVPDNYTKDGGTAYSTSVMYNAGSSVTMPITVPFDAKYSLAVKYAEASDATLEVTVTDGGKTLLSTNKMLAATGSNSTTVDNSYLASVSLKAGETYNVKIKNIESASALRLYDLILTTEGEYEVNQFSVSGGAYSEKASVITNANHFGDQFILLANDKYWADYEFDLPAGNYEVYIKYGVANEGTATAVMDVDGLYYGSYTLNYNGSAGPATISKAEEKKIATIRAEEGTTTLRFSRASTGNYYTLFAITLKLIEEPVIEMYSGENADPDLVATSITNGAMTTRVLLPKEYNGKDVTVVLAVYEGNALHSVSFKTIEAEENSVIGVTAKNISLKEGKNYRTKVLIVDTLTNLVPYCANPEEGILTN